MLSGRLNCALIMMLLLFMLSGCQVATPPVQQDQALPVIADEITVADLQQAMVDGELSAEQIVDHYIAAIERENDRLHAVISINPQARIYARVLDNERAAGRVRGP